MALLVRAVLRCFSLTSLSAIFVLFVRFIVGVLVNEPVRNRKLSNVQAVFEEC